MAAVHANPCTYEPVAPESVGNERRILLGKHTGHRAIRHVLKERGQEPTPDQLASAAAVFEAAGLSTTIGG